MAVTDMHKDQVLVELARVGVDGITRTELQERTAIGTQDLRDTLAELAEEDRVVDDGAKVRALPADAELENGQPPAEAAAGQSASEDESGAAAPEEAFEDVIDAEVGEAVRTYGVTLALDVEFLLPPMDSEAEPDTIARALAEVMQETAVDALIDRFDRATFKVKSQRRTLHEVARRPVAITPLD